MNASLERLFEELRPAAFAIAYRMLGSVSEAEDVVQEAFLRLHRMLREGERWVAARLPCDGGHPGPCIDQLRSARARRERYVGEWLPEPLLASDEADLARHAEVADSLSLAFLVLLESLSSSSAAYSLREVFDYPYDQIARIVGKSEDNTRQLVTWACRQVQERRPRFSVAGAARGAGAAFLAAAVDGELEALEELLADDVVLHGDGGGKAPALAHPVHGRAKVARTLLACFGRARGSAASACRPPRSTASPARCCSTRRAGWSLSSRSTSPTGRSRRSGRSSTPTSCGTSDPPPTSANSRPATDRRDREQEPCQRW